MDQPTKKRMTIMLISLAILFGCIAFYKIFTGIMIKRYLTTLKSPIQNVATTVVKYQAWQPKLIAPGTLRAIQGVNVTTQLAGMVTQIYFKPGQDVQQNALLVQLNAADDIALLQSLEANEKLAQITYERNFAQFKVKAISQQTLDTSLQNWKSLQAQVAQQNAIVLKKSIRAPFAGRLGINNVNLGQYINPGDNVTMLQTLNPIYVDFFVPQQALAELKINLPVSVTTDTFQGQVFTGKITTINPGVDIATRNVEVEATIANPKNELAPGMFVTANVGLGAPKEYLTLPQTAVTFNPFGDLVYVVNANGKDDKGPILIASQAFVKTGETRGEQVVILQGLKEGETVVSSGQLKLKNNSRIAVNNTIQPSDKAMLTLPNNH